jgi:hypothetical protein
MKQTRQAVRTIKQSVLLRCLCMLLIGTFQYDPFVKEAFDEEIVLFSIVVFDVNNNKKISNHCSPNKGKQFIGFVSA